MAKSNEVLVLEMYNFISNSPIAIPCLLTLAALAHALCTWSDLLLGCKSGIPIHLFRFPIRFGIACHELHSTLCAHSHHLSLTVCSEFPFTCLLHHPCHHRRRSTLDCILQAAFYKLCPWLKDEEDIGLEKTIDAFVRADREEITS